MNEGKGRRRRGVSLLVCWALGKERKLLAVSSWFLPDQPGWIADVLGRKDFLVRSGPIGGPIGSDWWHNRHLRNGRFLPERHCPAVFYVDSGVGFVSSKWVLRDLVAPSSFALVRRSV